MYCYNSITRHLIRGLSALMLIIGVFVLQLSLFIKLLFVICAFLLLRGCPVCGFLNLINKLQTNKRE
ncbi:hypothetical protein DKK79_04215 [Gilliamella apicola]|uniref:DUF2892 domain-containing protein n=1 Tax=Gilliamella apicola TaxID=1196095 RepID=A0A2V4E4S5_9GAMM|nr:hypothetical protein DKK79_04215 [Gilliamella apicola]